jgi:hypothetical protein
MVEVPIRIWPGRAFASAWNAGEGAQAAAALEDGGLVVLPDCAFAIAPGEQRFLDPRWLDGSRKNIGLDGERIGGSNARGEDERALHAMIARFAAAASGLVERLLPDYASHVQRARTSFRPAAASGRALSARKDDMRLHVDAFPSRPNRGERILRVFCNVNLAGEDRVWRVGEPFAAMAARFLPSIRRMRPGEAALLAALHVTKGRRSEYDQCSVARSREARRRLQREAQRNAVRSRPGRRGCAFRPGDARGDVGAAHDGTDAAPAARRAGERSPLATLERLTGHAMT